MKKLNKDLIIQVLSGLLIFVGTIVLTTNSLLSGLFLTLSGLLLVPSLYTKIDNKFNNVISRNNIKHIVIIVLLALGIAVSPSTTEQPVLDQTADKQNSANNTSENVKPIVNENMDIESNKEIGIVSKVTDGDTIRVQIGEENVPVRLIGIDTPEINHATEPVQCYGPEAKEELERLILNKEVLLEKDVSDTDKYDRKLRYVWLDETLVNTYMTRNGYAFASEYPPDTKYQQRIAAGESIAKDSKTGLWSFSTCNGDVYTGTYKDPNIIEEPTTATENTNTKQPVYSPPIVPAVQPSQQSNSKYICNCSKSCSKMATCEEAYFQLNECGCSARDGDDDGVPCESICK